MDKLIRRVRKFRHERAVRALEQRLKIEVSSDRRWIVRAGGADLFELAGAVRRAGDDLADLLLDDAGRLDPSRCARNEHAALKIIEERVAEREAELWGIADDTAAATARALAGAVSALAQYERERKQLWLQIAGGKAA